MDEKKGFGEDFYSTLTQGCEWLEFRFLTRWLSAKIIHKVLPAWPKHKNTKNQSDLCTLQEMRLLWPFRCNSIHITKPFFTICYQQKYYLQFKSLILTCLEQFIFMFHKGKNKRYIRYRKLWWKELQRGFCHRERHPLGWFLASCSSVTWFSTTLTCGHCHILSQIIYKMLDELGITYFCYATVWRIQLRFVDWMAQNNSVQKLLSIQGKLPSL